jgi:hypothetical protein
MRKILIIIALLFVGAFVYAQVTYEFVESGATFTIGDFGISKRDLSSSEIAEWTRGLLSESPNRWRLENASSMRSVVSKISSRYKTDGRVYVVVIDNFPEKHRIYIGTIYYPRNKNPIYTFYSRLM